MMKGRSPDYPASSGPYRPRARAKAGEYHTTCGAKLEAGFLFCPNCGAELDRTGATKNRCACGVVFGPEDAFCGSCGKARPTA